MYEYKPGWQGFYWPFFLHFLPKKGIKNKGVKPDRILPQKQTFELLIA